MKKAITGIFLILGLTIGNVLAQNSLRSPFILNHSHNSGMRLQQESQAAYRDFPVQRLIRVEAPHVRVGMFREVEWQSRLEPWMLDVKRMASVCRMDEGVEEQTPGLEEWMFDFTIPVEEPGLEEWMVKIENGGLLIG